MDADGKIVKYVVRLTEEERVRLKALVGGGRCAATMRARAWVLLKADADGPGWGDPEIAHAFEVSLSKLHRVREAFVERGLDAALARRRPAGSTASWTGRRKRGCRRSPAAGGPRPLDASAAGRQAGRTGDRRFDQRELRGPDAQKHAIRPHLKDYWVIPPASDAGFVCAREDVREVYHRDHDPERPVVCLDETSKQLVADTRPPVPPAPGRLERIDHEYERRGTANIFLATEPMTGQRRVQVTARRTAADFAHFLKHLADVVYPDATKIVLGMDNLNTHKAASLDEAFAPTEARRPAEKLEIHHTPKHGSWRNIAEIEFGILSRECLARRIGSLEELRREVAAWERRRNRECGTVDWQFTSADARRKLKRLYPSTQR